MVTAVVVSVVILCICYSRCYAITSSYKHAVSLNEYHPLPLQVRVTCVNYY